MGLGTSELLIIFGGVLLLFGGKNLPKLGEAIGLGIKNFRKGLRSEEEDAKQPHEHPEPKPSSAHRE